MARMQTRRSTGGSVAQSTDTGPKAYPSSTSSSSKGVSIEEQPADDEGPIPLYHLDLALSGEHFLAESFTYLRESFAQWFPDAEPAMPDLSWSDYPRNVSEAEAWKMVKEAETRHPELKNMAYGAADSMDVSEDEEEREELLDRENGAQILADRARVRQERREKAVKEARARERALFDEDLRGTSGVMLGPPKTSSSSSPLAKTTTTPSSKKRKSEGLSTGSSYTLDCELVEDKKDRMLCVVVFPPVDVARNFITPKFKFGSVETEAYHQRLKSLTQGRFANASEKDIEDLKLTSRCGMVVGRINLSQIKGLSIASDAYSRDVLTFQGGTMTLRAPFMPHENITGPKSQTPEGRAVPRRIDAGLSVTPKLQWRDLVTWKHWDYCPLPFAPPPEIFARLQVDLCLSNNAFQYGTEEDDDGFVDEVYGRIGRGKKLVIAAKAISKLISDAVTHPNGLVEINPDDETYFSRFPKTFYRQDPAPLGIRGHPVKGTAKRREIDTNESEGPLSLPFDNTLQSTLEACRPDPNYPIREPSDAIITPLMPFQKQALAWMLSKETCVDEDRGLLLPQWFPLRSRKSVGGTSPAPRAKRAKLSVNENQQAVEANGVEVVEARPTSFYFDMTTGMTTKKRYECRDIEAGGCLCDTMGLGKSIVVLAAIATNPWTPDQLDRSRSAELISKLRSSNNKPFTTPATLLIVPTALVEQWLDETRKHWRSPSNRDVVRWRRGRTLPWSAKEDRARIRRKAREILCNADIVIATYEDLRWELQESKKSSKHSDVRAISPLLEVKWHRIILDEAQMVSTSNGHAAEMVNSLWRSIGWIVTSTPFSRSLEDLFGLYTFLDSDLASKKVFQEVLANPFRQGDPEAIRRVRRALPKIMWRHDRRHVEEQLNLPPNTTIDLELEMTGLERAIYEREYKHIQAQYTHQLVRGRSSIDQTGFWSLRQLISHPQLSQSLGYGAGSKRATFEQLFDRLLTKSNAELHSRRMEVVSLILTLAYGHHARQEEKKKRMWKGGPAIWSQREVEKNLREARTVCSQIIDAQQEQGRSKASNGTKTTGDDDEYDAGKLSSIMRPQEALYWCDSLLGEEPEHMPKLDPERMTKLFFDKEVVEGAKIDREDTRYHPMTREDVGEDEEIDSEAEAMAASMSRARSKSRTKARANEPSGSTSNARGTEGEFVPTIIKQRLRGGKVRKDLEEKFWHLVPKTKLETSLSQLTAAKQLLAKAEREHLYLRNRMQDEIGHHDQKHPEGETVGEGEDEAEQTGRSCIVCMDAILVPGMLPCLHSACYECLVQCWRSARENGYDSILDRGMGGDQSEFAKKARCPFCRAPFSRSDITEVIAVAPSNTDGSNDVDDDAAGFGAKISGLVRDIRKRREEDPRVKIVVFSMFKKYLSFVSEALLGLSKPIVSVAFSGLPELQANALAQFRDDDGIVVMLVPMRQSEGAAGLTLTMASVAYFLEPSLDPGLEQQASGRLNRIGQQGSKTTNIRLIVKDTIEPRIVEIARRRLQENVQTGGASGASATSNDRGEGSSRRAAATMLEQGADGGMGNYLTEDELALVFDVDVPAAKEKRRQELEEAREANRTARENRMAGEDPPAFRNPYDQVENP